MSIARCRQGFNPQSKLNKSGTPIYVGGRVVGHVAGDTFHKTVRGSKHMLRRPRGWASDVDALRQAMRAGAVYIELTDTENGAVYRAAIGDMLDNGVHFNRGFGEQVALPLDAWTRPDLGRGEQLSLFGEGAGR